MGRGSRRVAFSCIITDNLIIYSIITVFCSTMRHFGRVIQAIVSLCLMPPNSCMPLSFGISLNPPALGML